MHWIREAALVFGKFRHFAHVYVKPGNIIPVHILGYWTCLPVYLSVHSLDELRVEGELECGAAQQQYADADRKEDERVDCFVLPKLREDATR